MASPLTVVVRFRPGAAPPYDDHAGTALGAPWSALAGAFTGITIRRRIRSIDSSFLEALAGAAPPGSDGGAARLLRTFEVKCPPGIDADAVASALRLWPKVESAYVQPGLQPAGIVAYANNPNWPDQGYLGQAPDGLNALCAWQLAGGDGSGQTLVDIEADWALGHQDLPATIVPNLLQGSRSGTTSDLDHGLMTLGVICAADNSTECVGFAPAIDSVKLASYVVPDSDDNLENAITAAVASLQSTTGGVILLEVELDEYAFASNGCVDLLPAVRHAIKTAVEAGIVVVEAAGNGSTDLDLQPDAVGHRALDKSSDDYDDSGAILVGAATSATPHFRISRSWGGNYGGRVDCYAWGENVKTLYGTNMTTDFDGTSSAAALVAGAAVLLQGIAKAQAGAPINPWVLRDYFRDPANGTLSGDPPTDRIGVMPDLAKLILNNITTAVPEVYARDFVGDDGSVGPTTMMLSMSPDIIVRRAAVVDPQGAYGEGSGSEDDVALSQDVVANAQHWVYVRVRNRGGADATNIEARVYWAESTTLMLPDYWNKIGTIIIPSIPAGDVLTVSPEIPWAAADVPASGHYCFIAEIVDPFWPGPPKTPMADIFAFMQFVRDENDVVWRNFNVVEYATSNATTFHFDVWVPAPPGGPGGPVELVVDAALPPDAKVEVLLAEDWLRRIKPVRGRETGDVAPHVAAYGSTIIASGVLPPGVRGRVRLTVHLPVQRTPRAGRIALRQRNEQGDLGRVTWRLVPKGDRREIESA